MTAAIPYIRFSTPKQEKGDSKERQLETCLAFIEQQGWIAQPPLMDLGLSAYKGDHLHTGALGKFTRQVIEGEIPAGTILVVEQLDRLSRQGHRKALRWLEDMAERGIKVAVVAGARIYDEESLRTNFIETIEVLITGKAAHDYSERLSLRIGGIWRKKIEATKEGKMLTRTCPGWLEPVEDWTGDDGTSFKRIPSRVAVVNQIYQWSADGYGIQKITTLLNQQRVEAWGRTGKGTWSQTHVLRILEQPTVEGDYVPYLHNRKKENGERVVGYYPRAVDADLVSRARAALKMRRGTGSTKTSRATYNNLLAGMLTCDRCGGRASMRRGPVITNGVVKQPGYLACETNWQGRGCEGVGFFRYLETEQGVLDNVLRLAMDNQFFRQPVLAVQLTGEVADAEKALADLKERLANVMLSMERVSDPTPFIARFEQLNGEVRAAEAQLVEAKKTLLVARGAVSDEERFSRAREVREAIMSEDAEVRVAARLKISQALKGVVDKVTLIKNASWYGKVYDQLVHVMLKGGTHQFMLDGRGNLLTVDTWTDWVSEDEQAQFIADTVTDEDTAHAVEGIVRRQRALSRSS